MGRLRPPGPVLLFSLPAGLLLAVAGTLWATGWFASPEPENLGPGLQVLAPTGPSPVNVPPSSQPPGGLAPAQVPQFVVFGSDDNFSTDGNRWLVDELFAPHTNPQGAGNPATFDGTPVRGSFYVMGEVELMEPDVAQSLREAYLGGHEMGNHTYTHRGRLTSEEWRHELQRANDWLSGPVEDGGLGMPLSQVYGFRAPFIKYNAELYEVLEEMGFTYDASIIEGFQPEYDGTNTRWPYTLDQGSPAAAWLYEEGWTKNTPPGSHPGLWLKPLSVYYGPPELEEHYGVPLFGCDWNLLEQHGLTPREMAEVFKHTLGLRLQGNRAPLHLCIHSHYFGGEEDDTFGDSATRVGDMRAALAEMVEYALGHPEVRVVRAIDVLRWMEAPTPLESAPGD